MASAAHVLPGIAVLVSAAVLAPASTVAQGVVSTQGQIIAYSGQPVPGVPGATFGAFKPFTAVVIDASGEVLFRSWIEGGGVTTLDDSALFHGSTQADLSILARAGDPAPGLPGLTLNTPTAQGLGPSVRLSADGHAMFGSSLDGATTTVDSDSALFGGLPGSLAVIAREGDLAPGTAGAKFASNFAVPALAANCTSLNGNTAFKSSLSGHGTSIINDHALFTGVPGAVTLLRREADTVLGIESIATLDNELQLNQLGQILYDATLSTTHVTAQATTKDDETAWLWIPGFGHYLVLREGDAVPGTVGAVFGTAGSDWKLDIGPNAFNTFSQFAFDTSMIGGDTIPGVNDRGIFVGGVSGPTMIARLGDTAPGTQAVFATFEKSSVSLSALGSVAFLGSLTGGSSTVTNDTGIWLGTAGALTLIAREGTAIPGLAGSKFGSLDSAEVLLNDSEKMLFLAKVVGTTTGTTSTSLFAYDPSLGVYPLLLQGEWVKITPGTFKTANKFDLVGFNNGSSAPLSLWNDGSFVLGVTMTDDSEVIVKGHIGSLNAVPAALSVTTGGTQKLYLDAGSANAGAFYLVAGSVSGTSPGIQIGALTLPLNVDAYFSYTLANPNSAALGNTFSVLDSQGRSTATFTLPTGYPGFVGATAHHAFGAFTGTGLVFASEAASLEFVP